MLGLDPGDPLLSEWIMLAALDRSDSYAESVIKEYWACVLERSLS